MRRSPNVMNNSRVDLVVVGGGIAGLTAANRGAQLGLKTVVLEKGVEEKYLCNTRYTGGTLHICMDDIMAGEETHLAAIERICDGARPDLARAVARNAGRAVCWLQGEGCKFIKASASPHHRWVLAPPGRVRPGLDWEGRSGDVLLRRLGENLAKRGGTFIRGARAKRALTENGRCIGVTAEIDGATKEFNAKSVILADGGFQASLDLLRNHITEYPEKLHQRNAGTGVGDGLRMAQEAGAAVAGTERFYGHLLSLDALTKDGLWPYPYLDSVVTAGVLVGKEGSRFTDEGLGGVNAANGVALLKDPQSAAVVFDDAIWETAGRHGLIAANPHLPREGATMYQADNLGDLARMLDMPNLEQTIEAYNAAIASGATEGLSPPRSTLKGAPMVIQAPPFRAAPVVAGITYTMGGVSIDGNARVLSIDDTPIEGFYAAGATTGGLEGGSGVGYVGGLSKSAVTGLLAAEHAAGVPAH
jgi:fumarate reductase flavoprotein subunit